MLHLTQDGYPVYDRHKSHLHKEAIPFLEKALARLNTEDETYLAREIVFDEVIGVSNCVTTTSEDEIVFAQRKHRNGVTRFVKNRLPIPSHKMVVVLKRSDCGSYYVLITAFVGDKGVMEPWDWNRHLLTPDPLKSYQASIDYWETHALIWDPHEIEQGTETVHPWH